MIAQLIHLRMGLGLKQIEVCTALKTHKTYVTKVESGERRIDPIELLEFLSVYRVSIRSFFLRVK